MSLDGFLITYGSALVLPLAVIEGPIVAIIMGFLTAQGIFHWYWTLGLLVCGDLIGDIGYYCLGRTGRTPFAAIGRRLGARAVVTPELQRELKTHSAKTLLVGKWTHSIGCLVLIGSGMLRLPLPRFILINLLATVPKVVVLFLVGYCASSYYAMFTQHAVLATVAFACIGVAAILLILRQCDGLAAGRRGQ